MEPELAEQQTLTIPDAESGIPKENINSLQNDDGQVGSKRSSSERHKESAPNNHRSPSYASSELTWKPKKRSHKCALAMMTSTAFIFLLTCVVVLSALLYSEKMSTNLLMNELYSQNQLLDCLSRQAGWSLCPRYYQPTQHCSRRISIDCTPIE